MTRVLSFLIVFLLSVDILYSQVTSNEIHLKVENGKLKKATESLAGLKFNQDILFVFDNAVNNAKVTFRRNDNQIQDAIVVEANKKYKINGLAETEISGLKKFLVGIEATEGKVNYTLNQNGIANLLAGRTVGNATNNGEVSSVEFMSDTRNGSPLLRTLVASQKRYFKESNRVYLIYDEFGKLVGRKPVNLDEDDIITVFMVVPKDEKDNYSIEDVGIYAPTDLVIRSSEALNLENVAAQSTLAPTEWHIITKDFGPYTSETIEIIIKKKPSENEPVATLSTQSMKINDLVHVGVGASFISTNLENPGFDVFPLNGGNTINTINEGNRTMFTFNVIWYWWSTVKYLFQGSDITRGRDVLKEANFLERINPTFGVAIERNFRHNLFGGVTFEFARGGSLVFGAHYGRVQKLADKNFKLGETLFNGSKDDIKLTNENKWGTFFGITLDTRIFNRLTSVAGR